MMKPSKLTAGSLTLGSTAVYLCACCVCQGNKPVIRSDPVHWVYCVFMHYGLEKIT